MREQSSPWNEEVVRDQILSKVADNPFHACKTLFCTTTAETNFAPEKPLSARAFQ
jgi:hypothetical protein